MATTIGSFSAIDDTEVDAESPITETLVTRLRDNSYWIDAGTRKTTQTSQTKVLVPDGSGGVAWVEVGGIAGIDGSKGSGTMSIASGTPTQIAVVTGKIMRLRVFDSTTSFSFDIDVDNSDDSYLGNSAQGTQSGTVTGTFASFQYGGGAGAYIWIRKVSTNYEFYISGGGAATTNYYSYIWL